MATQIPPKLPEPTKLPWYLLKNADGNQSVSYTLVILFSILAALWFFLGMFEHIGPIHVRAFSGAESMPIMTAVFALYFGRKHQEQRLATATAVDAAAPSEPTEPVVATPATPVQEILSDSTNNVSTRTVLNG